MKLIFGAISQVAGGVISISRKILTKKEVIWYLAQEVGFYDDFVVVVFASEMKIVKSDLQWVQKTWKL